jgi:phytanoyl-CoA hydroxylase
MDSLTPPLPVSQARSFFAENGYYLAPGIFSPDEISCLEEDFDRIVRQISGIAEETNARWSGPEMDRLGAAATRVVHTHNVQRFSGRWREALCHAKFLDLAEALIGPDIILHHSKLFMKPPEVGAPFPMHQDWLYFPTVKDTMIAAVIHVSEATDEMGCFRVYPGTHKLGRVEKTSGADRSELLEKHPVEGGLPLEAKPGDVLFFHYFLLHGSLPNRSARTRKTVLVQMHAGDDEVEPGNAHPNEQLVLRGWNPRASRSSAGRAKKG